MRQRPSSVNQHQPSSTNAKDIGARDMFALHLFSFLATLIFHWLYTKQQLREKKNTTVPVHDAGVQAPSVPSQPASVSRPCGDTAVIDGGVAAMMREFRMLVHTLESPSMTAWKIKSIRPAAPIAVVLQ